MHETDMSGSADKSGTGSCATPDWGPIRQASWLRSGAKYGTQPQFLVHLCHVASRLIVHRVLCLSPFRHESIMHSLGGLFCCLHQALNLLSVRPPSTFASRRGWEPNFGLPLHGVSLSSSKYLFAWVRCATSTSASCWNTSSGSHMAAS